jgi:hypothetical protein
MSGEDLDRRARARVGKVLDEKYLLERLIGVGGMAAVYAARHRNGSRAAVKLLHPEIARDEEVRGRFLSEGYAANRVEHPGAVRVVDDDVVREGEDKGTAYLVMELLDGESVYARAKRKMTLGEEEVLTIAEGVLDVLASAHDRGIVHRDLKPDNLFLVKTEDGRERVKVLDFGIARIADAARRTNAGQALGTPSYMSPEQAKGNRDLIDGRSDLFSLGATMFRLLTGRRVHDAESPTEILVKMSSLPAPPIRSVAPNTSPALAAIVDRALAFNRDARYRDAAHMREDVRAARAGATLPSSARPVGFAAGGDATGIVAAPEPPTLAASPAAESVVLPVPVSGTASTEPVREPLPPTASHTVAPVVARPSRRDLAMIIGAGAAFLAVVITVLFFVFGRSKKGDDGDTTSDDPPSEASEKKVLKPIPIENKEGDPRDTPSADVPAPAGKPKPTATAPAKPTTKPTSAATAAPAPTPTPTATSKGKGKGKSK